MPPRRLLARRLGRERRPPFRLVDRGRRYRNGDALPRARRQRNPAREPGAAQRRARGHTPRPERRGRVQALERRGRRRAGDRERQRPPLHGRELRRPDGTDRALAADSVHAGRVVRRLGRRRQRLLRTVDPARRKHLRQRPPLVGDDVQARLTPAGAPRALGGYGLQVAEPPALEVTVTLAGLTATLLTKMK